MGNFQIAFHVGTTADVGLSSEPTRDNEPRPPVHAPVRVAPVPSEPATNRIDTPETQDILGPSLPTRDIARPTAQHELFAIRVLVELTDVLRAAIDADDLFARGIQVVARHVPCDVGAILRGNVESGTFACVGRWPSDDRPLLETDSVVDAEVVQWTLLKNVCVVSQDVTKDPRFSNHGRRTGQGHSLDAVLSCPILAATAPIAVVYLARPNAQPFVDREVIVVETMSRLLGVAHEWITCRSAPMSQNGSAHPVVDS